MDPPGWKAELVDELAPAVLGDGEHRLRGVQRGERERAVLAMEVSGLEERGRPIGDEIEVREDRKRARRQKEVERSWLVELRGAVEDLRPRGRRDGAQPEGLEGGAPRGPLDQHGALDRRRQVPEQLQRVDGGAVRHAGRQVAAVDADADHRACLALARRPSKCGRSKFQRTPSGPGCRNRSGVKPR